MRTTSSLPSSARWVEKSATSSPSLSVDYTIVSFIGVVTNAPGGTRKGSIRSRWPQTSGAKHVRSRRLLKQFPATNPLAITTDRVSAVAPDTNNLKIAKRSQVFGRMSNDILPANRGPPKKRAAQYWTHDRRGQEKVAAQCRPSRTHRRNRDLRVGRCRRLCSFRNGRHGRLRRQHRSRKRTCSKAGEPAVATAPSHRDRDWPVQNPSTAFAAIQAAKASSSRASEDHR